jgi:hypothetical protein
MDQFPNIDVPTVVVTDGLPRRQPRDRRAEVTKKIEEAVNTVAGISSLFSRSYEGSSVVIIEFNLDVDGRKAADDVREKVSLIRPLLRDEVKDPRISRFDPASQPIFNVAMLAARRQHQRAGPDHLGHPGAAKAHGERARRGLGQRHRRRGAPDQDPLRPAAMEAAGWASTRTGGRAAQREPGTAAGHHPFAPNRSAWCRSTPG